MTDLIETDAAFDDRMAALEAEADAAELADDEQELSQELVDHELSQFQYLPHPFLLTLPWPGHLD